MGKRKKRSGHYCWVCGRTRANERFSGAGHRRHVCRDCAKLGPEELAYRQAASNLARCVTWEGFIPRKRRADFERFLEHDDPRIRAMARNFERADADNRARSRAARDAEELAEEMGATMIYGEAIHDDDHLDHLDHLDPFDPF